LLLSLKGFQQQIHNTHSLSRELIWVHLLEASVGEDQAAADSFASLPRPRLLQAELLRQSTRVCKSRLVLVDDVI
jgi:hypothetical protein